MSKSFFDFDDGDFGMAVSDNMAMDMDTGDIHFIFGWSDDEDDD